MNQIKTRRVVNFPEPIYAPAGWEIYNAPRPLYGTVTSDSDGENYGACTWQGDFISGVHYAAIDPNDPDADRLREENRKLDATRLVWVTQETVIAEMVEYYNKRFSADRVEKIFKEHPLDDPKTQKMLVDTWFNLGMNREE